MTILGKTSELNKESQSSYSASQLPLVPIIGTVVSVLLICVILIDVSCFKINKIGNFKLYKFIFTLSF